MDPRGLYAKAQRKWKTQRGYRDPYIAIIQAELEGRGVNLTAEDCRYLAGDSAVSTVASNHVEEILPEVFDPDGSALSHQSPTDLGGGE